MQQQTCCSLLLVKIAVDGADFIPSTALDRVVPTLHPSECLDAVATGWPWASHWFADIR